MPKQKTFFALMICFSLASSYAHPVTPTYFKLLGFNDSMFGLAFAFMALGMFLASPFWGKVSALINSKLTMALGSAGYGLGQIFFAYCTSAGWILVGRLIAGLACGAFFVGALTYITNKSTSTSRGQNLAINATIQTVAGALGYFIGGLVGAWSLPLILNLQIIQLFLTACGLYWLLETDKTTDQPLALRQLVKEANPFRAFLASRQFMNWAYVIIFLAATLVFSAYTAVDQAFNYYLKDVYHLNSSYNGLFKGAVGLISLLANTTVGLYLMKKTNVKKSLVVINFLASLSLLLALILPGIWAYVGLIIIFYGFYAIVTPLLQDVIAMQATKANRSLVLGFYQAINSLGMIIGAFLAGGLYDLNTQLPFIFGLGAFLLASLLSFYYQGLLTKSA